MFVVRYKLGSLNMREEHLPYLVCPACKGELSVSTVTERKVDGIETGRLACASCSGEYGIVRGVPRFVGSDNYASSFGFEWKVHARTQYDSYSGTKTSERRFFGETEWKRDLRGQSLLEVGGGSGRFTEQAAATGAFVASVDYSDAVDSNAAVNGGKSNVLIVQADVYEMPFRWGSFDKVFCFGMIQHTPDPRKAFMALPVMLRPGGSIVCDVYKKSFTSTLLNLKYYARWMTRDVEHERLYNLVRRWIDMMWPVTSLIGLIPWVGPAVSSRLLVPDYRGQGLSPEIAKEWAYLDAFDMLSARYDAPQRIETVREWCKEAGLSDVVVKYGYNGIEASACQPLESDIEAGLGLRVRGNR